MDKTKIALIICDGIGDRLTEGKTPLEEANKENFDEISKKGINGLMYAIAPGIAPGSDTAHLSILGYDPYKYYTGRGPFEALGNDMELLPDDIAFRANFSTLKNGKIIDRRAGREEYKLDELSKLLNFEIGNVKAIFKKSSGHRGVLILRGKNLSPNISETDPEEINVPVKKSVPLDNTKEAKFTAEILNKFSEESYKILNNSEIQKERIEKGMLPANAIVLRGVGKLGRIENFKEKYNLNGVCVAGVNLIKGVAKAVNLKIVEVEGANGHPNSNINGKFETAIKLLKDENIDFAFIHIKGIDEISHDGNFEGKVKMIERVDKSLGILLNENLNLTIALTGDHSTPVTVREHTADPVPIAILGDVLTDDVKKFTERECAKGYLGHIRGMDLMNILINISNRYKKFGA